MDWVCACVSTYIYVIDDEKKTKIRVVIEPTYLTLIIAFEGLTESGGKLYLGRYLAYKKW